MIPPYYFPVPLALGCDYASPVLPLFQADGVTPAPLAGYRARLMLRVSSKDQESLVSITDVSSALGAVVLGGAQGTAQFTISQAAIAQILPVDVSGLWSLFLDSPSTPAVTTCVASGNWTLSRMATQ